MCALISMIEIDEPLTGYLSLSSSFSQNAICLE